MTDFVYILFFVAFAIAIYKGGVAGRKREKRSKGRKPQYPTRSMYNNYYRTGDRRYLYDKNFKGR